MFDFIIAFDSLVTRWSESPYITGGVWIQLADREFPERGWVDVPLSVFGSFGTAIENVLESGEADFYFFEGYGFAKILTDDLSGADPIVRVCGVHETFSKDTGGIVGDIEAECHVSISHLRNVYMRRLRELREWAELHERDGIMAILSQMRTFD